MPQEYMSKLADQMDTVQSNTKSKKSSATTKPASSTENLMIIKTLAAGANHPANKATRFLEGAVLTITDPHLAVDSTKFPDTEFRKPTTYKRKITKVVNGTNVVMPPYKITRISDGQQRAVPLNDFTFSITYEKTIVKPNISGVFKKSYADIQFSNLQTFSGDVYKAKIFTKEKGSQGDFEKIGEIVLDGQNQLVNPEGATGFETIGIYHTQSIIEDGWVTSSVLSSATQGEDDIAASVTLSGSNGAHASDFTFVTKNSYGLQRNEDYIVSFDTYFNKSNKSDKDGNVSETAELEVFLTGSINSPTASEVSLGTLDNTFEGMKGRNQGYIPGIFNYFKTHNKAVVQPEAKLGFRVKSGNFKLANVALTPYFEKNFNPVSFRTLLPMPKPVKRGQRFDFYTEFYDFNNNKAGFLAETSASIVFDGAPQILADGTDGLLTGSVFLGNTTGSGIELHGGSAYMRSLGYDGFNDTISNNVGGFLIFSGSVSESMGTTEDYEGVGLEIVDAHGSTDRFLKFRTNPSEFTVQTDQFFFGKEGQFISGSNGNIVISSSNFFLGGESTFVSGSNDKLEISSSNFHLDNDGSVIMAGTITAEAGGTIGGFAINSDNLTATNFVLNTTDKALTLGSGNNVFIADADDGIQLGNATFASAPFSVTPAGVLKATSGTIGGFTLSSNELTATNFELNPSGKSITLGTSNNIFIADGDVGIHLGHANFSDAPFSVSKAGAIKAESGVIGGFTITDSKIETSDFVSGLKGVRISTEQNGLIEAENAKIRGTLATTTFEKETVNAVGGQLHVANATMITGSSMGLNDTSASVANVSGFTAGEVVIAKKVSGTGFNTEYMRVHSSSRLSTDDNDQSGLLFVTRSFSNTTIAATGSEGFRGEAFGNSSSYDPGQVIVSTGKEDTGYIRLNANPNDTSTPYIDIVERTGSGIYDLELKARLGDLSGLSRNVIGTSTPGFGLFSENVFLTGTISASAGSIGGISLDSDKLFSGAGTHGNSNTAFFLQGGTAATRGDFSLGDKFVWDSSESTLNIDGTITIGSISGLAASTASVDSLTSRVIITNNDVTVAHNSGHNKGIFNAAGLTVIGNNQTGSVFGNFGAEIYGASDKNERLTIGSNGVSLIANNITGSVITAAGTTIFGASDKNERLDVNAAGVTLIANNITGSSFTATTSSIFGSSDKHERVEIVGTGFKVYENNKQMVDIGSSGLEVFDTSNNSIASFGSAVRVGLNTSDKTALRIDSSGNLTIGTSGTQEVSIAANGSATFSGDLNAAGGTFSGQLVIGGSNTSLTSAAIANALSTEISGSSLSGSNSATTTGEAAKSDAASAQSTANTANSTANTANTTANNLATQVVLNSGGMELKNAAANTTLASYGSTTTIGPTSTEHIKITSTTLELLDGSASGTDASRHLLLSKDGIEIGQSGSFVANRRGDVQMAGNLFVGGPIKIPTRTSCSINNANEAGLEETWTTIAAYGTLSQHKPDAVRFKWADNENNQRWFYKIPGRSLVDGHNYEVSGKMVMSGAKNVNLIIGPASFTGTYALNYGTIGAQGTSSFSAIFNHDSSTFTDQVLFFYNSQTGCQNMTCDIENLRIVDLNATGSNSTAFATIGGFNFDGNSMFRGEKQNSSSVFPDNGNFTLGMQGGNAYISAPSFSITPAGDAKFQGEIFAEAKVEIDDGTFVVFSGASGTFVDQVNDTVEAGGASCVLRGTKVITQRGEVKIEDTKESDLIKVYDWFTEEWGYSPIDKILSRVTKEGWSHIKTEKGYELKCSNSHLLYHPDYPNNAIATDELGVGGQLYIVQDDKIIEDYIESIEVHDEPIEVWNYELKLTHNYVSNGILSHNALPKQHFTGTHKYFVTSSTDITSGDTVKLDSNNYLIKTTTAKDSSCIGIATDFVENIQASGSLNLLKSPTPTTRSLQLDSFGEVKDDSNYRMMVVASLGDNRDIVSYNSGSNGNFTFVTSSYQAVSGFKICNQGGDVTKGDLLCTSDTPGYLMKQPVEYVITEFSGSNPVYDTRQNINSFTVGKSMESCSFDSNGKTEGVYGYIYCG